MLILIYFADCFYLTLFFWVLHENDKLVSGNLTDVFCPLTCMQVVALIILFFIHLVLVDTTDKMELILKSCIMVTDAR